MIVGVSRSTIQRNVLEQLFQLIGGNPPPSKNTECRVFGRNVYLIGAHDEGSVRNIQGSTLCCAYVDEATCIPQPFFKMLLSRLSASGAKLFATCNPEGLSHWLKKDFIDRAKDLDLSHWHFVLDDNPSLDEDYKRNLKNEYQSGVWYRRLILGEWVSGLGVIYDGFDQDNIYTEPKNNPLYKIAAIDYGTINPTCCLIAAINPKVWPQICIQKELYYDPAKSGRSKSDAELALDIKQFVQYESIRTLYIDPAAASLKIELRNLDLPVVDADNDVLKGIQIVSKFINGKNLLVHKGCKNLIEQLQSYEWDPKAADRGEDKPIKRQDHACISGDSLIMTPEGYFEISCLTEKETIDIINFDSEGNEICCDISTQSILTRRDTEVFEIELEDGKKLIVTEDHKFMTQRGMIPLNQLTLCDTVLVCNINSTTEKNST